MVPRNVHVCICIDFLLQLLKQKNAGLFPSWDGMSYESRKEALLLIFC